MRSKLKRGRPSSGITRRRRHVYVPQDLDDAVVESCERVKATLRRAYTYTDYIVDAVREKLERDRT